MSDGSLIFDTKVDKEGFNNGINDIRKNLEKAQNQMVKEFEKTQNAMKKTEVEIDKVSASLDVMYREAKSKYDGLPNNQKLIDAELAKNAEYQKSIKKIEELNSQYTAQEKQCKILKDNINELTEKKRQLNDVENNANRKISIVNEPIKRQAKGANTLEKAIKKLASRFKLLITAMIIRGAINAVKEGFNDLARYSKDFNGTMSQLQGTFLQARNSIATAFAPVLQALTPIIITVTNGIINLMNAIAQVNAVIFKNSTTFTKAKKVTTDYAKSLGNASKKADKSFANFDEINQLTKKEDTGTPEATEMFEEETIDEGILNIVDRIRALKDEFMQMWSNLGLQSPFDNWLIDVGNLSQSLTTLWNTVVGGLKEDFKLIGSTIQQLIAPIVSTVVEDILPVVTQVFDEIVKTVTVAFSVLNKVFQTIWKGGIEPVLLLLVDIWTGVWDTIHNSWDTWGEPIFENIRTLWQNLSDTFQNVWDNYMQPIWQNFMDMVDWLWEKHLQPLLANFLDFAGVLINEGLNILSKFILPVYNFLVKTFGPYISNFKNFVINIVGSIAGTIADVISGVITNLKGIITFISGVFTGDWDKAWEGIVTSFKGIFEQVKGIVKGVINVIISLINAMIDAMETSLNWIVDKVNAIEITNPLTGNVIWSPSLESFSFNRIPMLATGTVVPANYGNFLAMLGDNKRETEVVSPLSTMKQALIEALQEYGGQNITIGFEETSIGDLVRLLKPYIDKENRRVGSSMRLRGAY